MAITAYNRIKTWVQEILTHTDLNAEFDAVETTVDEIVTLVDAGIPSAGALKGDTVSETTPAAGVTVDGVKLKDSQVYTDTINEKTGAAGVTIDGVPLKDGLVDGRDVSALPAFSYVTATLNGASAPTTLESQGLTSLVRANVGKYVATWSNDASGENAQTITCHVVDSGAAYVCVPYAMPATNQVGIAILDFSGTLTDLSSKTLLISRFYM